MCLGRRTVVRAGDCDDNFFLGRTFRVSDSRFFSAQSAQCLRPVYAGGVAHGAVAEPEAATDVPGAIIVVPETDTADGIEFIVPVHLQGQCPVEVRACVRVCVCVCVWSGVEWSRVHCRVV